jgi:hypothetical protein
MKELIKGKWKPVKNLSLSAKNVRFSLTVNQNSKVHLLYERYLNHRGAKSDAIFLSQYNGTEWKNFKGPSSMPIKNRYINGLCYTNGNTYLAINADGKTYFYKSKL